MIGLQEFARGPGRVMIGFDPGTRSFTGVPVVVDVNAPDNTIYVLNNQWPPDGRKVFL